MGISGRAALFLAPGEPLRVRDVCLAEPGPLDVVVRIRAVAICGSDLHVLRGEWPRPTPMVLGHEGAGVIEVVGDAVTGLAVGDHVVLSWAAACGACGACERGRPAACPSLRRAIGSGTMLDGTTGLTSADETVYRMATVGALAERVLVPAAAALKITPSLPFEQAALLGCAALTGIGAVSNAARVTAKSVVVVIGAGAVGQFVVQGARLAGASAVIAVDPAVGRLEHASRLGATLTGEPSELEGLLASVAPEGADYAFDAVGHSQTAQAAIAAIRPGGTAVLVGMPPSGTTLEVDQLHLIVTEKVLLGSIYGSADPRVALPQLVEQVEAGRLELGPLVGATFPLEGVNDAIAASLDGTPGRALVCP
jgi:S-(hydroxymethyl)glutathione dehydrogenase/alcohol dehydrogenase